jgi:putative nucleotidyltransferase with HDIG domain
VCNVLPRLVPSPTGAVAASQQTPPPAATTCLVPRGFQPIPPDVLSGLTVAPCAMYIRSGTHALLFATAGADAVELRARVERGAQLLVRDEDADLLRRALADGLTRVLTDHRVAPTTRSRTAYVMCSQIVGSLFVDSRTDRETLNVTRDAIDAVVMGLLEEEDLLWGMVAKMQKHLTTHTHAINTAVYSVILARLMGLTDMGGVQDVGRGALLHDIGKVRVPPRILDKPGPLDEDEWRVIKSHPEVGYQIVERAMGCVPSYAHIILEHHERCDGSGYPGHRRSNQVALDSQLVAIADAFDALTSARPYKRMSPPFEALRIMRFDMSGQFNDDLLRDFILLIGGKMDLHRADYRELEAGGVA